MCNDFFKVLKKGDWRSDISVVLLPLLCLLVMLLPAFCSNSESYGYMKGLIQKKRERARCVDLDPLGLWEAKVVVPW